MERHVGSFLAATGALHTVVGLIGFRRVLVAIGRGRIVNSVDRQPEREAAFWFLSSGLLLVAMGGLCRWTQRRLDGRLPAPLGWGLLASSVAGVVIMPLSGLWLIIPQALLVLRASRSAPDTPAPVVRDATDEGLLARLMPAYDVRDAHTRRIAAPPEHVYAALKRVTPRAMPIVGLLTGIRELPARLTRRPTVALPQDRPLFDSFVEGGFMLLAEEPNREVVLGVIERFWQLRGSTAYPVRDPDEFITSAPPGYVKVAVNFHLRPERGGTLLSTETRVLATDAGSRRAFARYWRVIYPGSALIRWALLRAVDRAARGAARASL